MGKRGGRQKNGGGPREPRPAARRRTPPPEGTGEEMRFLERRKVARTPLVFHMMDGHVLDKAVLMGRFSR